MMLAGDGARAAGCKAVPAETQKLTGSVCPNSGIATRAKIPSEYDKTDMRCSPKLETSMKQVYDVRVAALVSRNGDSQKEITRTTASTLHA